MALNNGTMANEVESRLEELFGDEEDTQLKVTDSSQSEPYHLRVLKTIVLSIDWEINDGVMTRFIEQVGRLRGKYRSDKAVVLLLQILDFIGKYIKFNKSNAHPDAIKVLNSVFSAVETTIASNNLSPLERKKILLEEVKKFNALKQHIPTAALSMDETRKSKAQSSIKQQTHSDSSKKQVVSNIPVEETLSKATDMLHKQTKTVPSDALAAAVQEIKQLIHDEMEALKKEIFLALNNQ